MKLKEDNPTTKSATIDNTQSATNGSSTDPQEKHKYKKEKHITHRHSRNKSTKIRKPPRLIIKANVIKGINITINNSGCNPMCCLFYNGKVLTTSTFKNTSDPIWDTQFKIKLPVLPESDTLRFLIFDKLSSNNSATTTSITNNYNNKNNNNNGAVDGDTANSNIGSNLVPPNVNGTRRHRTNSTASLNSISSNSRSPFNPYTHNNSNNSLDYYHHHLKTNNNGHAAKFDSELNSIYKNRNLILLGEVKISIRQLFENVKSDDNKKHIFSRRKAMVDPKFYNLLIHYRVPELINLNTCDINNPSVPTSTFVTKSVETGGKLALSFQLSSSDKSQDLGSLFENWKNSLTDSLKQQNDFKRQTLLLNLESRDDHLLTSDSNNKETTFAAINGEYDDDLRRDASFYDDAPSLISISSSVSAVLSNASSLAPVQDILLKNNNNKNYSNKDNDNDNSSDCGVTTDVIENLSDFKQFVVSSNNERLNRVEASNYSSATDDFLSDQTMEENVNNHNTNTNNNNNNNNNVLLKERSLTDIVLGLNEYQMDTPTAPNLLSKNSSSFTTNSKVENNAALPSLHLTMSDTGNNQGAVAESTISNNIIKKISSLYSLDQGYIEENESEEEKEEYVEDDEASANNNPILTKRSKRRKHIRTTYNQWNISKKNHALGVVLLDVVQITGLPSLQNMKKIKFKKTYTMDPFVIVTFGRRVFKTSWKRHSLNPVFNERIVFEMYPEEKNFKFHFNVVDKDSFSSHDKIAQGDILWEDLNSKNKNIEIPLILEDSCVLAPGKNSVNEVPKLHLKYKFLKYNDLKTIFWENVFRLILVNGTDDSISNEDQSNGNITSTSKASFDIIELTLLLEKLGDFSPQEIDHFFQLNGKSAWTFEKLTREELIFTLVNHSCESNFRKFNRCLFCHEKCLKISTNIRNSKLITENDLITHMARCPAIIALSNFNLSFTSLPKTTGEKNNETLDNINLEYNNNNNNNNNDDDDEVLTFGNNDREHYHYKYVNNNVDNSVDKNNDTNVKNKNDDITAKNLVSPRVNTNHNLLNVDYTDYNPNEYIKNLKLLKPSFVSSSFASKKWVSRVLIKMTYGKYALGSNNANILVQDRDTGIVIEEKISAHVKLGIRILYNKNNSSTTSSKKFKTLLKNLTIKQGKKFDDPASTKYIDSFIQFHSLDLSECKETSFKTFNEFFYRKLKPGARLPEVGDPRILISPADSRCTVFNTISKSKEIWIKGRNFTLENLTNGLINKLYQSKNCSGKNTNVDREYSIGIFRLAPQDYHRFHCPCDGRIGKPKYIKGEYYTVNPMAVRTELDVFGENVRCIIPIESPEFGTLLYIPVGAMMVGSIKLTCKEGDEIKRGTELGYFKFGGSTVLVVIPKRKVIFDSDLVKNSIDSIETLVKVGMSVGHTPGVKEFKRERRKVDSVEEMEKIRRSISVVLEDNITDPSSSALLSKNLTTQATSENESAKSSSSSLKKLFKGGKSSRVSTNKNKTDNNTVNDSNNGGEDKTVRKSVFGGTWEYLTLTEQIDQDIKNLADGDPDLLLTCLQEEETACKAITLNK
ncbi:uncharacterized protein SCODWIG_00602 [Saccharomycodes ludwigii]|uniref:Phosphatidylserine decarboxylase proenzyme 2 n=1 Tax=Saccharomycodes ludwigii TaxID=36035 RepID=A0A376B2G4_9ASCO|nr:uncharacterized protein SCODWIG_00602 [Saccharomycodes ludwigii]